MRHGVYPTNELDAASNHLKNLAVVGGVSHHIRPLVGKDLSSGSYGDRACRHSLALEEIGQGRDGRERSGSNLGQVLYMRLDAGKGHRTLKHA